MLIAVLARHAGLNLTGHDVYVNVAGGLRIEEPAADLAVAVALASSLRERPVRGGDGAGGGAVAGRPAAAASRAERAWRRRTPRLRSAGDRCRRADARGTLASGWSCARDIRDALGIALSTAIAPATLDAGAVLRWPPP